MAEAAADASAEAATRIEQAWSAAQEDLHRDGARQVSDAAAARFIDALLAEPLICPVMDDVDDEAGEAFTPRTIMLGDFETMPLFDTEERLADFIDEPTGFVVLPGRAFFRMAAGAGAQIALNPGVARSETVFAPHVVAAVAELIDATEEEFDVDPDTPVEVAAPTMASRSLLNALTARVVAARSVIDEAWLFSARYGDGETAQTRLVLGLAPAADAPAGELRALSVEIARLWAVAAPESERMAALDVAILRADDRLMRAARQVGLGVALDG